MRREQYLTYLCMTIPGLVLYSVFLILPILMGIYYSMTDWTGIGTNYNFVGIDNYVKVLTNDRRFVQALQFNLKYTIFLVAGIVVIGFILALLLNRELKGRTFFRTLYFMPAVLSMITVGLVFKQVYFYVLPKIGQAINSALLSENIIARKETAIYGILFVHLWQGLALPTLLFLAGLQTIPQDLYEAAMVDGASDWKQFWHITIPQLRPISAVVFMLLIVWTIRDYGIVYVLTGGGPSRATEILTIYMYKEAFNDFNYGIAAACGFLMMIVVLIFVVFYLKAQKQEGMEL